MDRQSTSKHAYFFRSIIFLFSQRAAESCLIPKTSHVLLVIPIDFVILFIILFRHIVRDMVSS